MVRRSDPTPSGLVRVYVGRPSALGNPFPISATSTRALASLRARLDAGERLALERYCAPLGCHADVLVDRLARSTDSQTLCV